MFSRHIFNALVLRGNWTGVEKAVCGFAVKLYNQYPRPDEIVFLVPPGVLIPGIPQEFHYHLPWYTKYRLGRILFELIGMAGLARSIGAEEFYGPAYLLPPRIQCRTSLYIYDLHVYSCPRFCSLLNVIHYRLRMPSSIKRADIITVPSKRVRAVLLSLFPEAAHKTRLEMIPIPVLQSKIIIEKLRSEIRGKWKRYFLAVGAPSPRKNHHAVIEAWLKLPKPRPALLITGGNEIISHNEDDPEYLGYVTDENMFALYAEATALVYPSFDEGYGLPVAEAIDCGTRVITTSQIAEEFDSELISICGTDAESIFNAMTSAVN